MGLTGLIVGVVGAAYGSFNAGKKSAKEIVSAEYCKIIHEKLDTQLSLIHEKINTTANCVSRIEGVLSK